MAKGRVSRLQGSAVEDIEHEIASFAGLGIDRLRELWTARLRTAPPPIRSTDVLRRMLAWQIQAEAFGGLDAVSLRHLQQIADALERDGTYEPQIRRDLSPGVVLTRIWKGVIHKVTATATGFEHQDRHYRSLSDVARTITGTRWSGPRFFGLEQKPARSRKVA